MNENKVPQDIIDAAIQSQSAKVDDAQSQLEGDIAAFEKFEKECKELADTTAYAYRAFNAGLSHARSQSQSVQPTGNAVEWSEPLNEAINAIYAVESLLSVGAVMQDVDNAVDKCKVALDNMRKQVYAQQHVPTGSVREIARRQFIAEIGKPEKSIVWSIWKSAYDSAARNLPLQSIQLSDMFEAMVHGLLISPGYYKCEKKDIDIEHWKKNFDKWFAWYMENRNIPVGNGWTDDDMLEAYMCGWNRANDKKYSNQEEWLQQYKIIYSPAGNTTGK
jgi:hypothetical protein